VKKGIIAFIPKIIRSSIKRVLNYRQLRKNYNYDMERYFKYSFELGTQKTRRHYESDLIFYYHKIEKGLSLPKPRVGFGKHYIYHLLSILEKYNKQYGWDDVSVIALNTLYEYYYFNKKNSLEFGDIFKRLEELKPTINTNKHVSAGGVIEVTKEEVSKNIINFKEFAYSRYSIRNFAPGEVSIELLREAVQIAQKTPSVCNRQSWKVYIYSDENKNKVLKYQNGNLGFGEDASRILIVSCELKDFRGVKERNQSYIDGGMYAMSLIYALHSLGIGTCPLNLALNYEDDMKLKKAAKISDSEVVLMMIAIGHIPEKLKVAASPRRKVEEVMTVY
jgi:nitroreductase